MDENLLYIYCQVYEETDCFGAPYDTKVVIHNIFYDISRIKNVEEKDVHQYNDYGKSLRIIVFDMNTQMEIWERELYWNAEKKEWDNLYKMKIDGLPSYTRMVPYVPY